MKKTDLPVFIHLPPHPPTESGQRLGGPRQVVADHLAASIAREIDATAVVIRIDGPAISAHNNTSKSGETSATIGAQIHLSPQGNASVPQLRDWAKHPESLCQRIARLDLAPGGYPLLGRWASPVGCTGVDREIRRCLGVHTGLVVVLQTSRGDKLVMAAFLSAPGQLFLRRSQTDLPSLMAHMLAYLESALSWPKESNKLSDATAYPLSPTERALLPHLLSGLSEPAIAKRLNRSQNTIHCHIRSIYRKLGVRTRKELCTRFTRTRGHED